MIDWVGGVWGHFVPLEVKVAGDDGDSALSGPYNVPAWLLLIGLSFQQRTKGTDDRQQKVTREKRKEKREKRKKRKDKRQKTKDKRQKTKDQQTDRQTRGWYASM